MDLETFVKDSLIGITQGIRAANAAMNRDSEQQRTYFTMLMGQGDASRVAFDVAVTTTKEDAGKAGGALRVAFFEAGAEGGRSMSHEDVSRVKFAVKVEFQIS